MTPHLRSRLASARPGLLLVLLACGTGCGGKPQVAQVADHGPTPPPPALSAPAPGGDAPPATPPPREDTAPVPVFSLSADGGASIDLYQGWPLLVQAQLLHPRAFDPAPDVTPLRLAAPDGPWTNAVRLEVRSGRGEAAPWPFHLGTEPKQPLALDARTAGEVVWWLTPEETARLPEGDYQATGVLDATGGNAPDSWKGAVRSNTVAIHVRKEPAPPSASQEEDKYLRLADLDMFRGEARQALARLDELLAKQPASIGGLALKADVLAASDRVPEALALYQKAIAAFYKQYPHSPEGPQALLQKYHDLFNQALSGKR